MARNWSRDDPDFFEEIEDARALLGDLLDFDDGSLWDDDDDQPPPPAPFDDGEIEM